MESVRNPFVFLDVCIGSNKSGRIIIELFKNIVPKTAENFRVLCTGEKGIGISGNPLHLKGSIFHRVVPMYMIQGGDIAAFDGTSGESIYGWTFEHENFTLKHHSPGLLSMVNVDDKTCCSQFIITVTACPQLDGKNVVFGQVKKGLGIVQEVNYIDTEQGRPVVKCWIENCGELGPDDDWEYGELDGTEDIYPPYPADWSINNQQLQIQALEDVINKIKNSGNYYFKARNFVRANAKYRKALRYIEWSRSKLEECRSVPAPMKFVNAEQVCLLNGAAAFLERRLFRQALENSDMALKLDSKCAKALYRRGKAKEGLNEWASALTDLRGALILSRNNKVIQKDIICLRKLMLNYLRKEKLWCQKMFPRCARNQK
jgi:peptidyl-prolyl isomerase D